MISEEIKNKYIEMINKLRIENGVLNSLKEFIKSYDGSDKPELHSLILETISMVVNSKVLEEKSAAYDEMDADRAEMEAKMTKEVDPFNTPVPTESN